MVCQQFSALLLCRLFYLPVAWLVWPSSQSDIGRLNPIFRMARNWQLTYIDYTIQDLAEQADTQLFDSIDIPRQHCMHACMCMYVSMYIYTYFSLSSARDPI